MDLIPIDSELASFKQHLEINARVILSAQFGDGKTFFIDKFKEKYQNDYFFVTLYPVNYSVADNVDIFEYIKRDIIFQLSKKEDVLLSVDFAALGNTLFSWENAREVISFLLSSIPGGPFYDKLFKKGEEFYNKYESAKNTGEKYLKIFSNQKGGIYEQDAYTRLIEEVVQHIRETQKVVLIIEDLDRIDPAHLFRILNVLGAHIDCHYHHENCQSNKFGVDNIITVFDYEVTKHIFYHFYGIKANYEGYINKFKVNSPFFYSINKVAKNHLIKYIEKECHISSSSLNENPVKSIYRKIDELSVRDVEYILNNLEKQIQPAQIDSYNHEFSYSSVSSITLFIAILIRMGIRKAEIESYITFNIKNIELLNLLSTFLLSDPWFCIQSAINYNNTDYFFKRNVNSEGTIVVNISFEQSNKAHSESSKYVDTLSAISESLKKALSYVNE